MALLAAGFIKMTAGSTHEFAYMEQETRPEKEAVSEITIVTKNRHADPEAESLDLPAEGNTESQTAELIFAGDILLSDHVLSAYERGGGIGGVVGPGFLEEIRNADIFMANEEFPFSSRGRTGAG